MKDQFVGKYMLGPEYVHLFLTDGQSGAFYPAGDDDRDFPCIFVGGEFDAWGGVFQVLIHEALEAAAMRVGKHYKPTNHTTEDANNCVMIMHHHEFSELTARAGMFINGCAYELCRAWKQRKKAANKLTRGGK